jgi:hypothetical protein
MPTPSASATPARSFSVVEILIAFLITMLVMVSVFLLLHRGQKSFARGLDGSDENPSARAGLDRVLQDLSVAGYGTPRGLAVVWSDGGEGKPDRLSVVFADRDAPLSRPRPCAASEPCPTIGASTAVSLDPESFSPRPRNHADAYPKGAVLFALQGPNGDPECDNVAPGLTPLKLAAAPKCAGPGACGTVSLALGPAPSAADLGLPEGFDTDVSPRCAVIGLFHFVQYRVSASSAVLERRDLALGEPWAPVAENVPNLQVQFAQGRSDAFEDTPALLPNGADPATWVTRVRVTLGGRSGSPSRSGETGGVHAAGVLDPSGARAKRVAEREPWGWGPAASEEDAHPMRAYTTTVSLRNQRKKAAELGL